MCRTVVAQKIDNSVTVGTNGPEIVSMGWNVCPVIDAVWRRCSAGVQCGVGCDVNLADGLTEIGNPKVALFVNITSVVDLSAPKSWQEAEECESAIAIDGDHSRRLTSKGNGNSVEAIV